MKKIQFRCELISDVILNVKSASEGPNKTLDFIPGSCFLGIVASHNGYTDFGKDAIEVFHSGHVRFGDAHPSSENIRSLKIPASMFHPKMKKTSEECYIRHLYDRNKDNTDNGYPQQLKQCKNGFYLFSDYKGKPVTTAKSFAMKSAYDSFTRKSKDSYLYGYESLNKGQQFLFEVEVDNDSLADRIAELLCGKKHLGRSRTSQYGLVKISRATYDQPQSTDHNTEYLTVYADGRLIFLDEYGLPSFHPTAKDLGLETGEIDWSKSQIRTFQYSPWNFKRQTFDTDRCGIEKGSVFVIKNCTDIRLASKYIGFYRNEGFGKVIYNPGFLEAGNGENGIAKYQISEHESKKNLMSTFFLDSQCTTPLLQHINFKIIEQYSNAKIYQKVNEFVKKRECEFTDQQFASQWGKIRSIALKAKNRDNIIFELFDKTTEKHTSKRADIIPFAYLTHGVAKDKWIKNGRASALRAFLDDFSDDNETRAALINLASEMAKKCKQ